jgi:hypothetical protein
MLHSVRRDGEMIVNDKQVMACKKAAVARRDSRRRRQNSNRVHYERLDYYRYSNLTGRIRTRIQIGLWTSTAFL